MLFDLAEFRLINRSALRDQGFSEFTPLVRGLESKHPLRLEGSPVSKIREGVIALNDPETIQTCLAILTVNAPKK